MKTPGENPQRRKNIAERTSATGSRLCYHVAGERGGQDPYAGLNRFGRVIDNHWTNYNTSATLDQIKYTYDRASYLHEQLG